MPKVCDMDCLNCKFLDCIKDDVYYDSSSYRNRSETAKAYARNYQKKRRKEAAKKGLCIVCCKEAANHGVTCQKCFRRNSIRQKERYESKKRKKAYTDECRFCENKVLPGKKVCGKHYEMCIENLKKARESEAFKEYMQRVKEAESRRIKAWRERKRREMEDVRP